MIDRPTVIVAAYSARALASSASHAGFAPLSIDVFGDDDTREMSLSSVKLEGGLSQGLTPDKVADAVETLISVHDPVGLVYGAGFERQPETVAAVARRTRIFGNEAATLERAKDPVALAQICQANEVRHPPIAFAPPDEPELWLMKRRGGAGGAHIAIAEAPSPAWPDSYFQRRVTGKSISALFLASEKKAEIIGLTTQWTAPTPASPFRYGGAAGPAEIDPAQAGEVARSVAAIAFELDLVGLNSADFLVSADAVWLIEINPRPGATLDVFELERDPTVCASHRRMRRTPHADRSERGVQSGRNRLRPLRHCGARGAELARLGGRSIGGRNALLRRRPRVHGAWLRRDGRFGASLL